MFMSPENSNMGEGEGPGPMVGQYEPNNQVIDGETYYGDKVYDLAYEEAMELLASNPELPDDIKQMIISYFKTIEQ